MSMIGYFLLVSDEEVRQAKSDPNSVEQLIDAGYEDGNADLVGVDKAWHCLHFLFTGTLDEGDPPLDFIMRGGAEVGEDIGYGPARAFDSSGLKRIADALDRVDRASLVARFDAGKMNELEIYPPGDWGQVDPTSDETFGYFSGAFDAVKDLARRGRTEGRGLLVWLS
jgi:hypothetical protein